jgi:hypothetical protein
MAHDMKDGSERKGGKQGYMHEGLKTHSPPVYDESRKPIGSMHPDVDSEATRSEVGEVTPATVGPRTA